jgi:ATP-dependent DNA helicase PIF1
MISCDIIHAVDRTLRDFMRLVDPAYEHVPFGGKLFLFGGDFRQALPVIPRASKLDIVAQCLNKSQPWRYVQIFRLAVNMRVMQALTSNNPDLANQLQDFSDYLLAVGNGTLPTILNSTRS